jgi:hypothetical protein
MDPNIYKSPQSDLEHENRGPGSLLKAIAVGLLVDLGGTMLASIALSTAWALANAGKAVTADELSRMMITPGTGPFTAMMGIGLLMTIIGGYVCASIARRRDYVAPAVQGLILLGFGALGTNPFTWGLTLFMNIATVFAVMGGAWLRIRQVRPPAPPA